MREEALTKQAAKLFPRFERFAGFYLVGGTALSLQIGHRISVDLDFFSFEPLPPNLLQRVKRTFSEYSIYVTYTSAGQLNLVIDDVKITFLCYEYPVVEPLVVYKDIRMASIREIAAMKAFAIGKRITYKDYVDWYFLLHEKHVDLQEVIIIAKTKFGGDFNDRLFLGQLVSLEDIPIQKIDFLREVPDKNIIEEFLRKMVRDFAG